MRSLVIGLLLVVGCTEHGKGGGVIGDASTACLADFEQSLDRVCLDPVDCVLVSHDDCCGVVRVRAPKVIFRPGKPRFRSVARASQVAARTRTSPRMAGAPVQDEDRPVDGLRACKECERADRREARHPRFLRRLVAVRDVARQDVRAPDARRPHAGRHGYAGRRSHARRRHRLAGPLLLGILILKRAP